MKTLKKISFPILLFLSISVWAQKTPKTISVQIPTLQQEATSIWRTVHDINFFEKQAYQVKLPEYSQIDSLLIKSRNGKFTNQDYSSIYHLLEGEIYHEKDYHLAFQNVQKQSQLLNKMIAQLDFLRTSLNWDFKMYESYPVVFTLYGSGGSYDPQTGTVNLFTTKQGNFKKYKNPANTIIHEIVHIGIENSIVQKHHLPHSLKERIVDRIVLLLFKDLLPEYKMQNMGNNNFDRFLKEKEDIKNLDQIIEKYLSLTVANK